MSLRTIKLGFVMCGAFLLARFAWMAGSYLYERFIEEAVHGVDPLVVVALLALVAVVLWRLYRRLGKWVIAAALTHRRGLRFAGISIIVVAVLAIVAIRIDAERMAAKLQNEAVHLQMDRSVPLSGTLAETVAQMKAEQDAQERAQQEAKRIAAQHRRTTQP